MKLSIQTISIIAFAAFAIGGFLLFANSSGSGASKVQTVVVWGTLPDTVMRPLVEIASTKQTLIEYVEQDSATFERTLLEALASGTGPDLFLITHDTALQYQKFIFEIPYQSYSRRVFQNTFTDQANAFLTPTGVLAFPLFTDPLVMYYNRSILSSAFITTPPQFWDEVIGFSTRVTLKNTTGALQQSAIALGTTNNIKHFKEILAMMILQAGNPIITQEADGRFASVMNTSFAGIGSPADSALRFYTSFADSVKENYTWNTSLPESSQMFTNGDLGLYIGFASELPTIRQRNANLNFDVTLVPQTRGSATKATYGSITGVAISKGSKNPSAAVTVASLLASAPVAGNLSNQLGLPPVRRDLLANQPADATYVATFYNAAIIARSFPDPGVEGTRAIFKRMVDNVNARIADSFNAVQRADTDIQTLLAPYNTVSQ